MIEVRRLGISKGRVVARLVAQEYRDFLLAAGDDTADEEMFAALPVDAVSVRLGAGVSRASFHVDSFHEMRLLLKELTGCIAATPAEIAAASPGSPIVHSVGDSGRP